jgi:predicted Zn-dependent peptidase
MSFNHSKTSNGINVVTYSMPYVNSVTVNIIVKVGSRHESEYESGISHFLEHMAFKGTKSRSAKQIAQEFDLIGGNFNAYTSRENTVYHTKILAQHLRRAMDIMADILQNSIFDSEEIQKECQVILQEIAEVQDSPDDLAYEKIFEIAYGNSALGRSILGNNASIAKITQDTLREYVAKHYHAGNIIISFAGKIDHADAASMVEELFASVTQGTGNVASEAVYEGGKKLVEKDLEQTTIVLAYKGASYLEVQDFYYMQLLSVILGGGLSSRLFQKIREELGLAYSVGTWAHSYYDTGLFTIYAATDHQKANKVLELIQDELDKIQSFLIAEQELERAKAQVEANIYMAEERSEYKAEEVGKNFAIFGKYFSTDEIMAIIRAITLDDIRAIANKIFSSEPSIVVVGKNTKDISFVS